MRTYLILKEKARRFNEDKEIQALLAELHSGDEAAAAGYAAATAAQLQAREFDIPALTRRKLPYERLDQLVVELLLGVR